MTKLLVSYFIFPGLAFMVYAGIFASWYERKLTARIQWRVGPSSFWQPFYDLRKLLVKETILPQNGNLPLFVLSPFVSLFSVVLISNILLKTWLRPSAPFMGDMLIIFYLLAVPAVASILGAAASSSPYASLGASREIKLLMSYEVPFILTLLVPIIKTGSISFGKIITTQVYHGSFVFSISGFIAFLIAIMCVQAKLGLAPFDLTEAETELAGGTLIEYSGPLLAVWKLSKMILLVVAPLFLVMAFWGAGGWLLIFLKYVLMLTIAILIKNTNPRVKINQAMHFFWGPALLIALLAVLIAIKGY